MTPVLVDCDPGVDDALALMLALASPELEVVGVSTVAGNTTLEKTTANAIRVLEKAGRADVPVAAGADRPLSRPLHVGEEVHGSSGMDGPPLDPPRAAPVRAHAVDFLAETIEATPEPPLLVAIGPLTNVALLLERYPGAAARLPGILLMGGACGAGNVSPVSEFNIYVDPEAADKVFSSGLPLTMVGLDVTQRAIVTTEDARRIGEAGECGSFACALVQSALARRSARLHGAGLPVHDALAIAHLVAPDLLRLEEMAVSVDTGSGPGRGRTLCSPPEPPDHPVNAMVGVDVDAEAFARLLVERLSKLP